MTIRTIHVRERVMARNDEIAGALRRRLEDAGVVAVNMVSSPGSGKTALLERTLALLGDEIPMAVVTGDVQTQNDADRLARHTDRLVHAVVTDGACHLDARQVTEAVDALDLDEIRLLFVENVGNLVCPASWDLGEAERVVVFSITEGEDKPVKYPMMFRTAGTAILNKMDLVPHLDFDVERAVDYAREVNPGLRFFFTSARTGEGTEGWFDFLRELAERGSARRAGGAAASAGRA